MTSQRTQRCLARIVDALRKRVARDESDGGFLLVEMLIALSLITVIMAAVGVVFVSGLANSDHERSVINATQVATTAVNQVRSLDPSDLLTGRTKDAVITERNTLQAIPSVAKWISSDTGRLAYDNLNVANYTTSVDNGGTNSALRVNVPTVASTEKPGTVSYKIYKYIECSQNVTVDTVADKATCAPAPAVTSATSKVVPVTTYMRTIVAVVWSENGCPSEGCAFVTSTEIDGHTNPTFNLNQALPALPVIANPCTPAATPCSQTVAVGDVVATQLTVQANTGAADFTWTIASGSLPNGLALSPAGLIGGTVQGNSATATPVTIQVTDAFGRNALVPLALSYTVLGPLTFNAVGPQVSATGSATSLTLGASGGAGAPFTYSDPNTTLPPGLSLNASTGVISGTPTTVGNYTVTLSVADKTVTRKVSQTFSWTVQVPPLAVSDPGTQTATLNQALSGLQLGASGGSGRYSFAVSGLPAGLSASTAGLITGTPTALGTSNPSVTVTDLGSGATKTASFAWTVADRPTLAAIADQTNTVGKSVSVQASGNCPNRSCTYSITGQPDNVTIDPSSGVINGAPSSAGVKPSVTVKVTDPSGATATRSFQWTVYARPSVSVTASNGALETTAPGNTPSIPITYTCANTPCALVLAGSPPDGVGLSTGKASANNLTNTRSLALPGTSGTVYYTGLVSAAAGTASPTVTITDADSQTATVTNSWTVLASPYVTAPGSNVTVASNGTKSASITSYCNAGFAGSCSVTLSGAPTGIGLSTGSQTTAQSATSLSVSASGTATTYVTGKVTGAAGTYLVRVTVTSTAFLGSPVTTSSYAVWTVT